MTLLLAVLAGLLAGLVRAWIGGRSLHAPNLRLIWLVPVAFIPQWLAFYLPAAHGLWEDSAVAVGLVGSLALLLVFVGINRNQSGFWLLGLGLALNLLVIALNGGLMPISPDTVARLLPDASPDTWEVGSRLGKSKDIVLPIAETRLWWLSDRFLLPWASYRVAFSVGDVFIALGAFWLLWSMGGDAEQNAAPLSGKLLDPLKQN